VVGATSSEGCSSFTDDGKDDGDQMMLSGACSELRKVVSGAVTLWVFVCVRNISVNRQTDLRQIHKRDVSGPSLGRV